MIKISATLMVFIGCVTLCGDGGLAGFRLPRITHTNLDYALMPFLGYVSICVISWLAVLCARRHL